MKKLKLIANTNKNINIFIDLFPHLVTEKYNEKNEVEYSIDYDALKVELEDISTISKEKYQFTWPGKQEAMIKANSPIYSTLRPSYDESFNFEDTKNMYIKGDNLEALKLLQESYLNKIKMIYIDPPYNTGKDFIYKDSFSIDKEESFQQSAQYDESGFRLISNLESNGRFHSDWLSMMYSRLKLARNLLTDDGIIFMSIDDNEVHNLRKISDEIFGETNFITQMIWRKKAGGGNDSVDIAVEHEYILLYKKSKNGIYKIPLKEDTAKQYNLRDEKFDTHGPYKIKDLNDKSLQDSQGLHYDIECPDGTYLDGNDNQWKCSKNTFIERLNDNRIVFKKNNNDQWKVYYKIYLNEENGQLKFDDEGNIVQRGRNAESILYDIGLNKVGNDEIKKLFDQKPFDYPKPTTLIKRLLEIATQKDSLILDFFSGSATSADAVMQLNAEDGGSRKFIMVQIPEITNENSDAFKAGFKTICDIGIERIRRAGAKILEENKDKEGIENLDIGFRVFKVDSSNMKDVYYNPDEIRQDNLFDMVSNIKEDRTDLDLLFQVLLDSGVELTLPIKEKQIVGKKVYFVDGNVLAACFEDNLTEEFVTELAKCEDLLKVVFRDSSFGSDDSRINVEQIFKQYSPDTQIRVI